MHFVQCRVQAGSHHCLHKHLSGADAGQAVNPISSSKSLALGKASSHFLPGKGNFKTGYTCGSQVVMENLHIRFPQTSSAK